MKQVLLRFRIPEGVTLRATKFKDLVARACDGQKAVNASFFHYTENGQAIPNSEPDIRFVGGKSWVGILSRDGHMDSLLPVAGIASVALGREFGQPVPMEIHEPEYGIEATQYPVRYFFRDVVFKHANRWKGTDQDLVVRALTERLRLERDRLMLDLPGVDLREFSDSVLVRRREHAEAERQLLAGQLQIVVHDLRRLGMRLETAQGPTNQFVTLMSGSLSMCAKTAGYWQFGGLQSRGYGRLVPAVGVR